MSLPEMKHVNHPDDERYDAVTITTRPRWKESELSGDEYRFSYLVTFWRKGEAVISRSFSRLQWALDYMGSIPHAGTGFDREAFERTRDKCDNPGCAEVATVFYKRLTRYTRSGDELAGPAYRPEYRQFCGQHKRRGDCGLDDADHNYELLEANPS